MRNFDWLSFTPPLIAFSDPSGSYKGVDIAPSAGSSPRAPSLPESLTIASDEVTTILVVSKSTKI
jgi:hypothetical protein